jgi:uncharacterized Zn finger protein (UPF0148 family)
MEKPKKICVVCKVYLIEKIKDVYVCPVCKAIVNERLDDRQPWEKASKIKDL